MHYVAAHHSINNRYSLRRLLSHSPTEISEEPKKFFMVLLIHLALFEQSFTTACMILPRNQRKGFAETGRTPKLYC
jgi:hypothetical protein